MSNWVRSFLTEHPEYNSLAVARRARHALHLQRPDGLIEAHFTGARMHEDSTGIWLPIDTDLKLITGNYWGAQGVPARFNVADRTVEIVGSSYAQRTTRVGMLDIAKLSIKGAVSLPIGSRSGDSLIADGAIGRADWQHVLRLTEDGVRETITFQSKPVGLPANAADWLVLDTIVGGASFPDGWLAEFTQAGMRFPLPSVRDATRRPAPARRYARTVGGVQHIYTGVPVSWLATAAYPVMIDPDFNGGANDGTVYSWGSASYATTRSTSTGYSSSWLGIRNDYYNDPNYLYEIERGYLLFDTSSIGAAATVTQDNLTATPNQLATEGDGHFDILVVKQSWLAQDPLSDANREAAYDNALTAALDDSVWANSADLILNEQHTSGNLDPAWVNKTGTTYFSLVHSRDRSNTQPPESFNYVYLYVNEDGWGIPVLTVLYSAATTGTGTIQIIRPILVASSSLLFAGTGLLALAASRLAATGALLIAGAGAISSRPVAIAAQGTVTTPASTGAGEVVAATSAITGAGAIGFSGAADGVLSPAAIAATASETFGGVGAVAGFPATLAAAGSQMAAGTGAVAAQPAAFGGSGIEKFSGVGAVQFAAVVIAGVGAEAFVGTGAAIASPVLLAASGSELFSGTGAAAISPLALAGSGNPTVAGSGAFLVQPIATEGAGSEGFVGLGAATLAATRAEGAGTQSISGIGSVEAHPAALAGTGVMSLSGAGAVVIWVPNLAGTAALSISGTGAIALSAPAQSAEAVEEFRAAAAVSATVVSLAAAAVQTISGSGSIELTRGLLWGIGAIATFTGQVLITSASVGSVPPTSAGLGKVAAAGAALGKVPVGVS